MDLTKEIIEEIDRQEKTGELQEKIKTSVNKMIEEALSSVTDRWGPVFEAIKSKMKDMMCKSIEEYDFGEYLTKFSYIVDEAIKNPSLECHKKIANNLKALFDTDAIPDKITMRDLLEYYKDSMMERTYSDTEVEDDGEGSGFLKFVLEKDEDGYAGIYVFKTIGKDDEEIEDNRVEVSFWEDCLERGVYYISARKGYEYNNSIRFMSSFEIKLSAIQQRFIKITDLEDYIATEESVTIEE